MISHLIISPSLCLPHLVEMFSLVVLVGKFGEPDIMNEVNNVVLKAFYRVLSAYFKEFIQVMF